MKIAVLKGTEEEWEICYDTPITDDVLGYLTRDDVESILNQVEALLKQKSTEEFNSMSMEERVVYNEAYSAQSWYDRDVHRHDLALVQVVEEMGDKAGGQFAKLRIAEVSGPYRIDEYDGFESVETPDSYDWISP